MDFDIVIVGGGPAGLSAALALGRARKRVLVCDAGAPRNLAAAHIQGFVTRDGTPPAEFRRIARAELTAYPGVVVRDTRVLDIAAQAPDAFAVTLAGDARVTARRVLLCTGLVDELPPLPGIAEFWATSVHLCPYCHGWELRERPLGYLCPDPAMLEWALLLRGWSPTVVVFTDDAFAVPADTRAHLQQAGVAIEPRKLKRLVGAGTLTAAELTDGDRIAIEGLFVRPKQHQVPIVAGLGLTLDEHGFVKVDDFKQTSRPGIYAAGDLTTGLQGAIFSAAAGYLAGAAINHGLTTELALRGELE
ncbi:NAD(P)/FAD-dependent oxidoreductase [Nannocystis bainbridge]|uniref:NAD(P)/FAD-dependent oxidoreductase n=1 Tax=Nannocystis bainbridge TaxID=2995303 RepID=A0ABT5DVT7_9BACT|nr:NAD(P)/FAD-dependent oxidoreductase [Nannocystis bainbridge]MDC0717260.1 NAD(P)/FAD-dependent oxidoreductase [Nannocystis bainbridge]